MIIILENRDDVLYLEKMSLISSIKKSGIEATIKIKERKGLFNV